MSADDPRQLRVTVIGLNYSPEPTGIAPYTTGFAEGMAARGHTVTVLAAHPHYPDWRILKGFGRWTDRRSEAGVRVLRLRHYVPKRVSSTWSRLLAEITFGFRVATHSWNKPDVVVLVSPALFANAVVMFRNRLRRRRPPIGLWVQDLYGLGVAETNAAGSKIARFVTNVEGRVLRAATGVCVIHDRFSRHVSTNLGVVGDRISVIRNWTHLPETPNFDVAAFRAKLNWGPGETIVLHAGAQGAKQGLESVLDAARVAEQRGEPVRFVLLGKGGQRETLEKLSQGASHVEFVDPLDGDAFQMAMASADVLLVNERPGLSEMAVPSKLTSYFSTGRPVLAATDSGSVTAGEIELSEGGIRVDAGDPHALLAGVKSLRDDQELAQRLGASGRRFQSHVLGPEQAMEHLDRWIQMLADEPSEN